MLLLIMMIADEKNCDKMLGIYEKYHDNMLRYARSLLRCFGDKRYMKDGEDVIQSAFVRITKAIDGIDTTLPENVLGGYLMKIVKNEVIDFMKKQRNHASLDETLMICEECDYLEEFAKKELYIKVVKEIDKLDVIYRDVLRMNLIENMSIEEIAKALDVPPKTLYTRRARGIAILREIFKDEVL